jgi:hypothetical protein
MFQVHFVGLGKWFRGMFGGWPLRDADRSGSATGGGWRLMQGDLGDK